MKATHVFHMNGSGTITSTNPWMSETGFLKLKAGRKSLCIPSNIRTINQCNRLPCNDSNFVFSCWDSDWVWSSYWHQHPSAFSRHFSCTQGHRGVGANPSCLGVKAGNNLDESPSHRWATQKDKQRFAPMLTVWERDVHSFWNVEGGCTGNSTQKAQARNQTHNLLLCGNHCTTVLSGINIKNKKTKMYSKTYSFQKNKKNFFNL